MPQFVLDDVSEHVLRRLAIRAEVKGRALADEVHEILARAAGLQPEDRVAIAERIRSMSPRPPSGTPAVPAAALIRQGRDRS